MPAGNALVYYLGLSSNFHPALGDDVTRRGQESNNVSAHPSAWEKLGGMSLLGSLISFQPTWQMQHAELGEEDYGLRKQ